MAGEIDYLGGVNVAGSLATMGEVILWGFVVGLLVGIVYLIYYLMSFKNTLVIRDAVHGRKIVSTKKWKEKRDKENNIWLITPFNRIKKPLPPTQAVEITAKGKRWAEAWRGEDTETLIWITDKFDYQTYKEENDNFQPLTTQERELLVNEISKSKDYQKKSLYETIVQISLIMAPIILIAVIGLVLGDITEGLTSYAQPLTSTLQSVGASFDSAMSSMSCVQNVPVDVIEVPN